MKRFYDLFAGIGGFRLGLERNGLQCVGSCEIDKYARQIYIKNFGDTPEPDSRLLDCSRLPDFDILCAGFPCQSFSLSGKRKGFEDTRGTLFFEIARIAKEQRPPILFLENVKGLLYNDSGRTFFKILDSLEELGYDLEWQVINGRYFLPQNRQRVYIIGHLRDKPTPKIFPITTTEAETTSENESKGRQVQSLYIVPTMQLNRNQRNFDNSVFPNLDTWLSHGIYHNGNLRYLTPTEYERLQGFPDGWTEGIKDGERYRLLGNAVMVPVIEFIGRGFV